MTSLMTGHQHNIPGVFLMLLRKVFGAGVVSGLCACVFLQMLWTCHEPINRMEELDDVFYQETFRFAKGEFTEILSNMRDLDGDLLVDENGNPRLLRHIGKTPREYIRCWSDNVVMILLCRLSRPPPWVDLLVVFDGSRDTLSHIFTDMVLLVWTRYGPLSPIPHHIE